MNHLGSRRPPAYCRHVSIPPTKLSRGPRWCHQLPLPPSGSRLCLMSPRTLWIRPVKRTTTEATTARAHAARFDDTTTPWIPAHRRSRRGWLRPRFVIESRRNRKESSRTNLGTEVMDWLHNQRLIAEFL
ncbi:hypothetical protein AVEN_226463-1 [Araneus ventricosus]|uniref:Uncharacterized protein n=1 Tax=Araneus ventricosus TaxID=182803 RepID=A0A4Y2P533_ARAVE|nr:hypothetical protein AVEN_226463-1 [Araneus ventricosus]